jgi:hypothetical protein
LIGRYQRKKYEKNGFFKEKMLICNPIFFQKIFSINFSFYNKFFKATSVEKNIISRKVIRENVWMKRFIH